MLAMLTKPIAYLSVSFALFMVAPVLVSIGTTGGPRSFSWLGLAALCVAGLIPPVQRLLCGPEPRGSNTEEESSK